MNLPNIRFIYAPKLKVIREKAFQDCIGLSKVVAQL
jgi:hypothetical protein